MFPKGLCSGCICHVSNMSFSIYLPKPSHWSYCCVFLIFGQLKHKAYNLIFEWCEACWKAIMGLLAWLHVHNPWWGVTSKTSAGSIVRNLLLDIQLFKGLRAFYFSHLAVATWGFSTKFFGWKQEMEYSLMTSNMLCLKDRPGFVSLGISNIHSGSPWFEQCICQYCMWITWPDIHFLNT